MAYIPAIATQVLLLCGFWVSATQPPRGGTADGHFSRATEPVAVAPVTPSPATRLPALLRTRLQRLASAEPSSP